MDRRRALAMALVAVLIATLFATVPSAVRAQPAAPSAPYPAATVQVYAVTASGCSQFTVNLQCGHVFFSAYDPSDTVATVTIHDQNYSRDGIAATAMSWNVSFTTSVYNDSNAWGASYFIPLTLPFGGLWNITIHGAVGGTFNSTFYVSTYTVSLETTQGAYLARHTGTALYFVDNTVNSGPASGLTSLTLTGQYYTNTGTYSNFPGTPESLGTAAWGNFTFTVPSDASTYGYIYFELFANKTANSSNPNSVIGFLDVPLGYVSNPDVSLSACLTTACLGSTFVDGTPVYVMTQTWIISPGGDFPAAGLTASFEFDAGVTPATPAGGWPSSVTTNATGGAAILFIASLATFPAAHTDSVKVSVTDPLNSGQTYGPTTATFTVVSTAAGSAALELTLDSAQYYAGDTAKASWQLGGFNSSLAQGWTIDGWWAFENGATVLSSYGTLASTSTTGSFSVQVPSGYAGEFEVDISAHNATAQLFASAFAAVTAPTILLNPNEDSYQPGDTVTVTVTTEGQVFSNATLYASVADNLGNIYQNGVLSGNTITIAIPAVGSPSSVSIQVAGQDSVLGIVGTASLTLNEVSGLAVVAGVSTASNYADGSFQPGQTISLHYSFHAYGDAALAKSYTVAVYPYSGFYTSSGAKLVQTTATSGDVSYTIPSGTPAGAQLFEVYVTGSACVRACYGVTLFSVNVQPNPSVLQYNLGAGSGLTVGWLVLFLLGLLVAIVLVMMIRRRDRPKVMKPISPPTGGATSTGSSTPPSGATGEGGSSGGWQESSTSGSSSPPLPNPPK